MTESETMALALLIRNAQLRGFIHGVNAARTIAINHGMADIAMLMDFTAIISRSSPESVEELIAAYNEDRAGAQT